VFPQEGLTNYPGTEELLVEGLRRGATVLGGAPRYDTDHAGQIERIFALAREFDVDIDMHLDVGKERQANSSMGFTEVDGPAITVIIDAPRWQTNAGTRIPHAA